ncbi:MAG TPA: hypothetical protein VIE65_11755 [Methylobacter sp.]|jgi:hypothetical protein
MQSSTQKTTTPLASEPRKSISYFWLKLYLWLCLVFIVLSQIFGGIAYGDYNYQFMTALRMHALDIQTNNTSQLVDFEPGNCTIHKRKWLIGHFVEVTCTETNLKGQIVEYVNHYSAINYYFDHYYNAAANQQTQLVVKSQDMK